MRICIVTVAAHGLGGMQDHTRALSSGLVAAGHEVEVVTTRHPDGLVKERRDGVSWHYVDAGHHHDWLPRRDPAWLPRSYETFVRLHRRRPFHVVHSESTSAIGLVRKGVHRSVPLVAKYQGNAIALAQAALARARAGDARVKLREAKGLAWLFGEWFQYGHWYRFRPCVWLVPSRSEFEPTRRTCCLKRSLGFVAPNGIDAEVFRPRSREAVRVELGLGGEPLFAAAGRLNRQKGFHTAIRALAQVRETEPLASLIIAGDGEEREPLERLVAALALDGRVRFVGPQPHDVLAKFLAASDAFLFPTERAESFGVVLAQAMACGLPVVGTKVGAVQEVIGCSGESGLLVRPGSVDGLARAMTTLLRDESLRMRLGQAARRRVLANYTVERMVALTLEAYDTAQELMRQG